MSRIEFQGFNSLEDAQAFWEKNALDVERRYTAARDRPKYLDLRRGLGRGRGKRWEPARGFFGSAAILD